MIIHRSNAFLRAIRDLFTGSSALRATIARQHDKIIDLDAQIRELLKAKPLTESELADIARIRAENAALSNAQNEIVIYLRDNMPEELKRGLSFEKLITALLSELKTRRATKDQARSEVGGNA